MAFLKSIILLAFFIHWVKAAQFQYDIDSEFNRIFNQIRHSMDNAWRWMREAASKSYLRVNEIFTARKSYEQGRHKYEDVVPSTTPIKPENILGPLTTSPDPQALLVSVTSSDPQALLVSMTSSTTEQQTPSQENTNLKNSQESANLPTKPEQNVSADNLPETANLEKSPEQHENKTTKVSEPATEQTEPECEDDTPQEPATASNGQVDAQTQTEAQIPLEGTPNVNKLELPAVQDIGGDSTVVENKSESDDKMKIVESMEDEEKEPKPIVADPPEHIEFEMKRGLSRSIYEQQNIIILFLFFLIIIMSAYFFLLSRTPHTCPTIVIGELGGNLKPAMHNIKK